MEWALSYLSAEEFKSTLNAEEQSERIYDIHLEDLINQPKHFMKEIVEFLKLDTSEEVHELSENLLQKAMTPSISSYQFSIEKESESQILQMAGPDIRRIIAHYRCSPNKT